MCVEKETAVCGLSPFETNVHSIYTPVIVETAV